MSSRRNEIARDLLKVFIGAIPYGPIALTLFGDDLDRMMEEVLPTKERRSMLKQLSDDLAAKLIARGESMPKNSGSAHAAAYDVVESIKDAQLTFDRLREAEFDPVRLKRHMDLHRPSDWNFASNERRQMWDEAIEEFCGRLLLFFLNDQAFQTQILILLYRQQKRLLNEGHEPIL